MLVWGWEGAKAVLDGRGVVLGPGLHGFTDGNAPGGVGVVLVEGPRDADDPPVTEIATSVGEVFLRSGREGLDTEADMENLLSHGASAVAEMAAVYRALSEISPGAEMTIVSDYDGVAKLMGGVAKPKKPFMKQLVAAGTALAQERTSGRGTSTIRGIGHRGAVGTTLRTSTNAQTRWRPRDPAVRLTCPGARVDGSRASASSSV